MPLRVAAMEPGVLPVALALARAGQPVTVVDTDPHDLTRLRDMLPKLAGPAAPLLTLTDQIPSVDCLLAASDRGTLCTDWTHGTTPVLHLAHSATDAPLIEQIGADPSGHIARLAGRMDALHITLPAGAIPLSARFHACLSHCLETILLTSGTPTDIDETLQAAGFALGPFAAQDQIGIDTLLTARRAVESRLGTVALPLFARAVAEGRLGRKASVGWHRYPGNAGRVEDPLVEDMAVEEAHFANHPRRDLCDADIVARVSGALASLAADMVSEGHDPATVTEIAARSIGYAAL